MSAKRKLKRSSRSHKADPSTAPDKRALRRQTRSERFKTPGSDKLWEALLGWDESRLERIWLVQAVHDAATRNDDASAAFFEALPQLLERHRASLDPERIAQAVRVWADDTDDFKPDAAPPKWHVLVSFIEQLGWDEVSPEALQLDWETWTNLALAGKPRVALMQLLQQTEHASLDLDQLTSSDNIQAIANVSRALWFAVAYGDQQTFEKIRRWSSQFSPPLPGR